MRWPKTATRILRVQSVLESEPCFADRAKQKSHCILNKSRREYFVSKEADLVADALAAAGEDGERVARKIVVDYALKLLGHPQRSSSSVLAQHAVIATTGSELETFPVDKEVVVSFITEEEREA